LSESRPVALIAITTRRTGITLKGDEDGYGCVVKSILQGGAVGRDSRLGVGDHVVAVNDQSLIGLSSHTAR